MKKSLNQKQLGLSLIEASMVLALSAVVVAGAVMYYGIASDNSKVQRAMEQLSGVQATVATLYASQSDYADLDSIALQGSGALPNSYFNSDGKMINPWSGEVEIKPAADKLSYTMKYKDVPTKACVKLVTTELGSGVKTVNINETGKKTLPLSLADANTGCSAGTTVSLEYEMK